MDDKSVAETAPATDRHRPACPHCGWRVEDPGAATRSQHRTSTGSLEYRRCVCGGWLILAGTTVLAAPVGSGPAPTDKLRT